MLADTYFIRCFLNSLCPNDIVDEFIVLLDDIFRRECTEDVKPSEQDRGQKCT